MVRLAPVTIRRRLDELCRVVLDENHAPGTVWSALDELHTLLTDVSGLGPTGVGGDVDTDTIGPHGKAIAPIEAARCLYDVFRTQAFTAAVVDEVARRRRTDPSRPVHVLDAGCGPFAALVLPALARFGPDELRCTLIDLHSPSIDAVTRLIDALGLGASIVRVVQADATTYAIPDGEHVDVVVAECLQRGLSSEPQVAIVRNLVRQAGPAVTLIPHRIELALVRAGPQAHLAGPSGELTRVAGGPVFAVDVDTIGSWGDPTAGDRLPARTSTVEEPIEPPDHLALSTTIRVDHRRTLGDYRSGLTAPHPLLMQRIAAGTELRLAYDVTLPGIVVEDGA